MSGTPHIKSLNVAIETTFGSVDVATGLVDASAIIGYVSIECERAPILVIGETPVNERPDTRTEFYVHAPEPDTACDTSGNPIPRRTGQLTIDMVHRMVGSATTFADYAAMPIGMLFNSVFRSTVPPGALTDTIGAGVSVTEFTPGILGNFADGIMICQAQDGVGEYSYVTDASGANVIMSPAMANAPTGTMRIGTTFTPATQFNQLGPSLAFRGDGDGFRWYATGCRPSSVSITADPRMVKMSWTIECSHIYDDNGNAAVSEPVIGDGCVAHMLQARTVVSTAAVNGVAAPAAEARTEMIVDDFSASLTWTLASRGTSSTPIGVADLEVTDFVAEVDLMASIACAPLTQDTFLRRELHSVSVGLSNVAAGNGLNIYLPAAALQADPNIRDLSGDIIRHHYLFKQSGPWTGDATGTASSPGGKPFRIGLGN